MQVGLKIWRFNSRSGERELQEFEIDAPEEATLLDCLDIVKDRHDGSLAYRKSCRMMICGSCGMRMDGAAVLACKVRMYDVVQEGRVPVISAMGNLPILKDLVVDMGPFWEKFRSVDPYLQPGYQEPPDGREYLIRQERMNVIHKEALCINCGCCVSECNAMESEPQFTGPQALVKAMRFVGDPRDGEKLARLEKLNGEHGIWECTRCYFCNERCPKGVDPRDAIAKLGAESIKEGIDRDMGAKHAKWFVTSAKTTGWLRETELVPKTQGVVSAIKQTRFALDLAVKGKVPPPFPPHVAKDVREARRLYDLTVRDSDELRGFTGIVQGERALAKLAHGHTGEDSLEEIYDRPGAFHRPYIAEEQMTGGANEGMGSRTQADVTPGEPPTRKPGGGA
jgi:succinate dehydrogenase / fumarate reductase iron-sulfur subunit